MRIKPRADIDLPTGGSKITNWGDLNERKRAVVQLVEMIKDSDVTISNMEMEKIIDEVRRNPEKLQQSFKNIMAAYQKSKQSV